MRVVYFVCVLVLIGSAFAEWRPRSPSKSPTDKELFDNIFETLLVQYGRDVLESKAVVVQDFCDMYVQLNTIKDRDERYFVQSRLDELRKELDEAARILPINVHKLRQTLLDALRREYGQDIEENKPTIVQEYLDTYVNMQSLEHDLSRFQHGQRLDSLRRKLSK